MEAEGSSSAALDKKRQMRRKKVLENSKIRMEKLKNVQRSPSLVAEYENDSLQSEPAPDPPDELITNLPASRNDVNFAHPQSEAAPAATSSSSSKLNDIPWHPETEKSPVPPGRFRSRQGCKGNMDQADNSGTGGDKGDLANQSETKQWNLRNRKPVPATLQPPNQEEEESDADDLSYQDCGDGEDGAEEEDDDEVDDNEDDDEDMEDESLKEKPQLSSSVQTTSCSSVSSMDQ